MMIHMVRPSDAPTADITAWLAQLGPLAQGREVASRLYEELYGELHRLARSHMRREQDAGAGHTLSATGLVHEAWFRLAEQTRTQWQGRSHFMAVASTMMRRILVDHAVARRALKRDVSLQPISTTLLDHHGRGPDEQLVGVHEALLAFEQVDARAAKVVELRFFGGLELEEIAEALSISLATVKRDWTLARAWLRRELGAEVPPPIRSA
jgi:RNA polymerase sigma factor (TIGR02999 family)